MFSRAKEGPSCFVAHAISDELWERIKDFLPGKEGDPGVTAADNRLFVDAVSVDREDGRSLARPARALPQLELGVEAF